jgi:hypothetical protein
MTDLKAYARQIEELLSSNYPDLRVATVRIREITDSIGDPSLDITVLLQERPERIDQEKTWRAMDQFRTWLANRDDDRFPYYRFLTEDEERELSKPDD